MVNTVLACCAVRSGGLPGVANKEEPVSLDLVIETEHLSPEESAETVSQLLHARSSDAGNAKAFGGASVFVSRGTGRCSSGDRRAQNMGRNLALSSARND